MFDSFNQKLVLLGGGEKSNANVADQAV